MTREEQIHNQSIKYTKETHSPSSASEFQAAMNIAVIKAFTAGAQWADETILQQVLEWLEKNTYITTYYTNNTKDCEINFKNHFKSKEQMFQSFKERFNIE